MYKLIKSTLFLLIVGFIASPDPVMAAESETVLVTVNGTKITTGQIFQLPGINANSDFATLDDDKKAQIIVGLINRQLVLEQAKKEGFDRSEPISSVINDMVETFIVKQYLVKIAAATDLSEKAVAAYYEENFLGQPAQYEIAHILLATEDEANEVLSLLKDGVGFPELAKTKSKDKVSAKNGGDLGWLTSEDMMPSFYNTVSGLKSGETSTYATKTQFGWHIVRVNDKRESTPQPFNQVNQSIRQVLIEQKMADYLDGLRDRATIEFQ